MVRKVVPGYRYFRCEDCGMTWREPCRDHQTPSGSDCPNCQAFTRPHRSALADLPVDEFGNLIEP